MGYINMPELSKDVQDMINKGVEVIPSEVDYTNYYNKAEISAMAEEISKKISAMLDFNMVYTKISIDNKIDKLKNEINKINSIDTYSKSDIDRIINKIKLDLSNKLNAGDVYSKGEVEKLVNDAISSLGINPDNYYTKQEIDEKLSNVLTKSDVENSLSSEATDKAVSANQLRIINQNIESLKQSASDGHNRIVSTITSVTDELGDDHSYENICKIIKSRKSHVPKDKEYNIRYKGNIVNQKVNDLYYTSGKYVVLSGLRRLVLTGDTTLYVKFHINATTKTECKNYNDINTALMYYPYYNIYCACGLKYIFILTYSTGHTNIKDAVLDVIDIESKKVVIANSIKNTTLQSHGETNSYDTTFIVYCCDDFIILSNGRKVTIKINSTYNISSNTIKDENLLDEDPDNNKFSVFYINNDNELVFRSNQLNSDNTFDVILFNFRTKTIIKRYKFDSSLIGNPNFSKNTFMLKRGNYLVGISTDPIIVDLNRMFNTKIKNIHTHNILNYTAYEVYGVLYLFVQHNDCTDINGEPFITDLYIFKNGKIKFKSLYGVKPFQCMRDNYVFQYYNNDIHGNSTFESYDLELVDGSEFEEWDM